MTDTPLHIALNATAMLAPLTGMGRYVQELACALTQLGVRISYFDVVHQWRNAPPQTLPALPGAALRFVHNLPGVRPLERQVQQLRFSRGVRVGKPLLYHEPNYLAYRFSGPTVVAAHDASWVRHPETHPVQRVRNLNRHFPQSLERAERIIVDSQFTAREMHELFGVSFDRMRTVALGVTPAFRPMSSIETASVCETLGLAHGGYVLSVGTLEPRKNLITLVRAFSLLPAELGRRYPLVIAGMSGWRHAETDKEIAALERRGLLRVLGPVAETALPALYAGARLFVYPSIYEGFGLPPLEAMAAGIPVIVSDRASLPEVVGETGLCIDPYDVEALTATMRGVLEDPQRQKRMAAVGVDRAQGFTWQRCAQETLAVYREAVALHGVRH